MSGQHRYSEKTYCPKCGFATSIMESEKAMLGICPHCGEKGLKPLAY